MLVVFLKYLFLHIKIFFARVKKGKKSIKKEKKRKETYFCLKEFVLIN